MPVAGSRRYFSQKPLKPSITEVDGVIGYQAATVAPAYTQPSAVAVLPSIRILSSIRLHGCKTDWQRASEMLFRVFVADAQGFAVRFSQCFLARKTFRQQLIDDRPCPLRERPPANRRRRCS